MNENKQKDQTISTTTDEDKELSELLDSALADFTKEPKNSPTQKVEIKEKIDTESKEDVEWSDEFIKQAAEQFESNIANILRDSGGPSITSDQIQQNFQRMAEAAVAAVSNTNENYGDSDFASSISHALAGLTEGTENLQNPFSDADILNMFGQTDGEQNAFFPFMQGMMQGLLSKEVLYPSLKDILDKYPAWMAANADSLTAEDRRKYENQQEVMRQVCEQLEKETECVTNEQKKTQFDAVLTLMQKLQDYGQPPAELVGDLGSGFNFDAQGNPNLNQCSMM